MHWPEVSSAWTIAAPEDAGEAGALEGVEGGVPLDSDEPPPDDEDAGMLGAAGGRVEGWRELKEEGFQLPPESVDGEVPLPVDPVPEPEPNESESGFEGPRKGSEKMSF